MINIDKIDIEHNNSKEKIIVARNNEVPVLFISLRINVC